METTSNTTGKEKAITLRPYWAWAVCHAGKRIENRSRPTHYRGRLFIHAGLGSKKTNDADRAKLESMGISTPELEEITQGAIVAECQLTDCQPLESEKTSGALFENEHLNLKSERFAFGPFCYILENVAVLSDPVPLKGQLSLFNIPQAIRDQLK